MKNVKEKICSVDGCDNKKCARTGTTKSGRSFSRDFLPPFEAADFTWVNLGNDYWAKIDNEDAQKVLKKIWWVQKSRQTFYAQTKINNKTILLHRLILDFPDFQVDHKNGDGLDCRKDNLRLATQAQNSRNRRSKKLKGVYKRKDKWEAAIKYNCKNKHLGTFNTKEEAAIAYDTAAIKYFGEFACTNKMLGLLS